MFDIKVSAGFIATLLLLVSFNAVAERNISTSIKNGIETGIYPVGIGSHVNLKTEDQAINGPAIFIGNTVLPDGSNSYQMYLNEKANKVFYIAPDFFSRLNSSKLQKVLDSYEQAGGTCSAYAINNFLQQTNLTGFSGTGELEKIVKSEEGRTWLLADAETCSCAQYERQFGSMRGLVQEEKARCCSRTSQKRSSTPPASHTP